MMRHARTLRMGCPARAHAERLRVMAEVDAGRQREAPRAFATAADIRTLFSAVSRVPAVGRGVAGFRGKP